MEKYPSKFNKNKSYKIDETENTEKITNNLTEKINILEKKLNHTNRYIDIQNQIINEKLSTVSKMTINILTSILLLILMTVLMTTLNSSIPLLILMTTILLIIWFIAYKTLKFKNKSEEKINNLLKEYQEYLDSLS